MFISEVTQKTMRTIMEVMVFGVEQGEKRIAFCSYENEI